jgi:hypothetical protein
MDECHALEAWDLGNYPGTLNIAQKLFITHGRTYLSKFVAGSPKDFREAIEFVSCMYISILENASIHSGDHMRRVPRVELATHVA